MRHRISSVCVMHNHVGELAERVGRPRRRLLAVTPGWNFQVGRGHLPLNSRAEEPQTEWRAVVFLPRSLLDLSGRRQKYLRSNAGACP